MIKAIISMFSWKDVRNTGIWLYQENSATGKRRALRVGSAYQPIDKAWLGNGKVIG